jgi:hypothetical protein
MKLKPTLVVLSALLIASPSYAFFGLGDSKSDNKVDTDAVKSVTSALSSQAASIDTSSINPSNLDTSALLGSLTSQLGVSKEQAAGGTSALLALASSSLSGSQASELSSLIPGMDSGATSGLLSMASNMGAVTSIFEKLGLDPSMVSQFAPIILEYLTGEGASSGLLSSLGSLWK